MREIVYRILNLLNNVMHDLEGLRLKLNIPSKYVKVLLD